MIEIKESNGKELDEAFGDIVLPPDLKKAKKYLGKLNQCVDTLVDFDDNKWFNRERILPLLKDASACLSSVFKYYGQMIQGW